MPIRLVLPTWLREAGWRRHAALAENDKLFVAIRFGIGAKGTSAGGGVCEVCGGKENVGGVLLFRDRIDEDGVFVLGGEMARFVREIREGNELAEVVRGKVGGHDAHYPGGRSGHPGSRAGQDLCRRLATRVEAIAWVARWSCFI